MMVQANPAEEPGINIARERVLITGGSGFLGSHLCRRLESEGAEVHAVSRHRRFDNSGAVRWWQGDMTNIASARQVLHELKPDVVFHLSGLATASAERDLVLPILHSLLVSTVNLLMIAGEIQCRRIVLAASLTEPEPDLCESTPGSPYAAAKWASGGYARMFHKLYHVPVVMVRPFMTYGPGQDERKLVPCVILSLLKGEAPKLSSGQQQIDWIYVDDVVEGFVAAAQAPHIEGRTIDLGSGVLVSIRSVVGQIVQLIGAQVEPMFHALPDRPYEPVRVANVADAWAKLGWQARTPLESGLKQTIDWYKRRLKTVSGSLPLNGRDAIRNGKTLD